MNRGSDFSSAIEDRPAGYQPDGSYSLSDSEREQCIDIYAQLARGSTGAVQRYFYRQMVKLQMGRSAEQVERMEREKGLRE